MGNLKRKDKVKFTGVYREAWNDVLKGEITHVRDGVVTVRLFSSITHFQCKENELELIEASND